MFFVIRRFRSFIIIIIHVSTAFVFVIFVFSIFEHKRNKFSDQTGCTFVILLYYSITPLLLLLKIDEVSAAVEWYPWAHEVAVLHIYPQSST